MKETALKLADDMEGRAKIRRQAKDRLSVQEGANDRLADQLEQASDMIRKLVTELEQLEELVKMTKLDRDLFKNLNFKHWTELINLQKAQTKQCKDCGEINPAEIHTCSPQTKQLSDEEIIKIWGVNSIWDDKLIKFARAIEERHGIK